jgi:hypothetical protein
MASVLPVPRIGDAAMKVYGNSSKTDARGGSALSRLDGPATVYVEIVCHEEVTTLFEGGANENPRGDRKSRIRGAGFDRAQDTRTARPNEEYRMHSAGVWFAHSLHIVVREKW